MVVVDTVVEREVLVVVDVAVVEKGLKSVPSVWVGSSVVPDAGPDADLDSSAASSSSSSSRGVGDAGGPCCWLSFLFRTWQTSSTQPTPSIRTSVA